MGEQKTVAVGALDSNIVLKIEHIASLREKDTARAIRSLTIFLNHKNKHIQIAAAEALGQLANPRAIDPLVKALSDNDQDVRESATTALRQIGYIAIEPLIENLKKEKIIEDSVCRTLAMMKKKAIKPLIEAIRNEKSNLVRHRAGQALGLIGKTAIKTLIPYFGDKSSNVRYWVSEALATIGKNSIVPLIETLKTKTKNQGTSRDYWLKMYAALTLGKIAYATGDPKELITKPLITALRHPQKSIRYCAAYALGLTGKRRAVKPLIKALQDGNGYFVKEPSEKAFGETLSMYRVDDYRGFPVLVRDLGSKGFIVKRHAIIALARIPDQRAISPLSDIIDSEFEDHEIKKLAHDAVKWIKAWKRVAQ